MFILDKAPEEIPVLKVLLGKTGEGSQFLVYSCVFQHGDYWLDAPLLFGDAVAGKSMNEVLNLPEGTPWLPTVAVIPFTQLPGYKTGLSIGGRSIIVPGLVPRVDRDLYLDSQEKSLADRYEKAVAEYWANPDLLPTERGRPIVSRPAPGMTYSQRVKELYRIYLQQEADVVVLRVRERLRVNARTQARRELQQALVTTDELPKDWWKGIDRELHWKKRSR